jgi:hypothetical protein
MKPEQQRIAIAQACGWHTIAFDRGWIEAGDGETQAMIPDYLNDLNAMHEAERTMGDPQLWDEYQSYLSDAMRNIGWIYHATAAQRAEAFLKTLNLWK